MFNRFKPVPFEPYGRRSHRAGVPFWFWMLLIGIAIGGGGLVALQQRYLAPRLSEEESVRLRNEHDAAVAARQHLQTALDEATRRATAAQAARLDATEQLAASRSAVARLGDEVAALVDALPPDPRGGRIEVRAGQFTTKAGALFYDIVLVRGKADDDSKPLGSVMQMVVSAAAPRGVDSTVTASPVAFSVGGHQILHGSVPLPEGFKPREVSIRLLEADSPGQLGMRTLRVR